MKRRDRLMATLRGEPVDRPPVSFYEISGLNENPEDESPFNIYNDPSWKPLLDLARERTDRIGIRHIWFKGGPPSELDALTVKKVKESAGSIRTTTTIRAGKRVLTTRTRRDAGVRTTWTEEHLLKDTDDLKAYLELPEPEFDGEPDVETFLQAEATLGDSGIVLIDTPDPLCKAAELFDMGEYTITAMTENRLFRQLLDRFARVLYAETAAVAKALPGRLWRIYGPEYASPPYLPPRLFREYVVEYDRPMVREIQKHGGFARIHSHGRLRDILDDIISLHPDGLDPIEPPPQGDVQLHEVAERCGREIVLFGNLEASDIENLPEAAFAEKVKRALDEGMMAGGRGFVLMPSACPYGRHVTERTLKNYHTMVEAVEGL